MKLRNYIFAVIIGLCILGGCALPMVYILRSKAAFNRVTESDARALLNTQRTSVDALRAMVIQDANRSSDLELTITYRDGWVASSVHIPEKRKAEYCALFRPLRVLGVKGRTDTVMIYVADFGWAGDMQGKILYWQSPDSSSRVLTAPNRKTVKISDDGWWYVYYW